MIKITPSNFIKVNNSDCGNPRYVCHFLDLVSIEGHCTEMNTLYDSVIEQVKPLGGRKYHTKKYGGGIVFESYNLYELCERINKKLNLNI